MEWQDGVPFSTLFGDVYFSRRGGDEETQHVFMRGNRLPEAWQNRPTFCIGETGFGTGLNFLSAAALWRQTQKNPRAHLDFVSLEKHPLTRKDIQRALTHAPQYADLADALLRQYPEPVAGIHLLEFDHNIHLTLLWGDIADTLPMLAARVDAWFLDGFSPAKNPAMWTPEVFAHLARLSHRNTTCATFTAARAVRDGLEKVGFSITKQQGFAHKRDMLTGTFDAPTAEAKPSPHTVSIVGAGIAGCSVAHGLARRGVAVHLYDRGTAAMAASSNPAAVVYPRLTAQWTADGMIYLNGFLHTVRMLDTYPAIERLLCGVEQTSADAEQKNRQEKMLSVLGLPDTILQKSPDGILFPRGGWVNLHSLSCALIADDRVQKLWNRDIAALDLLKNTSDAIVLANAVAAKKMIPFLPLEPVRGQLSFFEKPEAAQLDKVRTGDGFALPYDPRHLIAGSTYQRGRHDTNADAGDVIANAQKLLHVTGIKNVNIAGARHWVQVRCATPQRFPWVGAVAGMPDVFMTLGHGSYGATSAPLMGELLARKMMGAPTLKLLFDKVSIYQERALMARSSQTPDSDDGFCTGTHAPL